MPKMAEDKCPVCRWSVHSWSASTLKLLTKDVAALVAKLEAIGEDPAKFKAFVNAAEACEVRRKPRNP